MNVVISDGSTKNFEIGDTFKIKSGALPAFYDGKDLSIVRFETHGGIVYPFVRFFMQAEHPETHEMVTVQDETSAVSGDLILP